MSMGPAAAQLLPRKYAYERAAATGTTRGWTHLVNEIRFFQKPT